MFSEVKRRVKKRGQAPGTAIYTGPKNASETKVTLTIYSAESAHESVGRALDESLLTKKEGKLTWVNVEGLSDVEVIKQICEKFSLHPLTIEDILNTGQRPKVEEFENYIYVTLKVLQWQKKSATFNIRQLSLILGAEFVISFQETDTELFAAISKRLQNSANRGLRKNGSDYLLYRMIDAVIDDYFVVLEEMGEQIEHIEEQIINSTLTQTPKQIYRVKQRMLLLRKAIWPMRETLGHLLHSEDELIKSYTRIYLRDVYDHAIQAIDSVETFRETLSSLMDMHLSSLTNRMNEIMKTLTLITTLFIPITAIASIYGMNFSSMPAQHSPHGFAIVMSSMVALAIFMIVYFRSKKWL